MVAPHAVDIAPKVAKLGLARGIGPAPVALRAGLPERTHNPAGSEPAVASHLRIGTENEGKSLREYTQCPRSIVVPIALRRLKWAPPKKPWRAGENNMHPGMFAWWNHVRRSAHHGGGCGSRHGGGHDHASAFPDWDGGEGGGAHFGVRRPLRFLAHKLDLSQKQVDELAKVLSDLKTERAQVAVDQRRTTSAFADAVVEETFDATKVEEIANERVKSQERLRGAVVSALSRIHALLNADQRSRLAYLLRTGALLI